MSGILHIEEVSVVAAILGGFILLYGLCSLFVKERLYLSEPSLAVLFGVIFGPICAHFVDVSEWGNQETLTHEFTRFVIGIQVMACGVALPKAYLRTELKSLLYMLGPVMIYMWLSSGLLVWALIPGLNFLESLTIAACFTPTDPVLSNSIVHGKFAEKHVAPHLRHFILAESGANDGLGYPFLFLAIYLLQMNTGPAIGKWVWFVMIYNILLSIIIGFIVGYVARKALQYSEKKKYIDKESFLVYQIALAIFLIGTVGLIGSDDLLACFIAGNSLTWNDWYRIENEKDHLMEVVDNLLNISIFAYIGFTMPWASFSDPLTQITPWRLIVLAILVLLLRRPPIIMAMYKLIPAIRDWREAVFTGWFGPMGVGAIFYLTAALDSIPEDGPNAHAREVLKPVVYFLVLASIVAHGITIPIFYMGSLATRTITKSSEHPALHLPKLEVFKQKTDHHANGPKSNQHDEINEKGTTSDEDTLECPKHIIIDINTPGSNPSDHSLESHSGKDLSHNDKKPISISTLQDDSIDATYYLPDDNDTVRKNTSIHVPTSRRSSIAKGPN